MADPREPSVITDADDDMVFGAAAHELNLFAAVPAPLPRRAVPAISCGAGDDDLVLGAAAWELTLVPTGFR